MPTSENEIIRSGVPLLDEWLGGVREGGTHLLTGGPGSGKSTLALHFVEAGLRRGEPVAMLVHGRADDVAAHAHFLGCNLTAPLRSGRLVLLRYRSTFVRAAGQAVSPEQVVADLDRMLAPARAKRLVIDTFSPFVSTPPPVAPIVVALVEWLERSGATSLLTFPEELSAGYDRNLEPLMQHAAAVIRLVREEGDVRRAELLNLRYPPPPSSSAQFVIRENAGMVSEHPLRLERPSVSSVRLP